MRGAVAKDDDYQFVPPDFDEDAFIHREMTLFRAGLTSFVAGIVAALVSWAAFAAMGGTPTAWFVGFLVFVAVALGIRPLYKMVHVDTSKYTKGNWFGAYLYLFLSWLAIFIVAVNPPFGDYAAPHAYVVAQPAIQQTGSPVNVTVLATDNVGVTAHNFQLIGPGGQPVATDKDFVPAGDGRFQFTAPALPAGTYSVLASVQDRKGHTTSANGSVIVAGDALGQPSRSTLGKDELLSVTAKLAACDPGHVPTSPCIRTVWLERTDGTRITLGYEAKDGAWKALSTAKGWSQGNNTVRVVAQQAAFSIGTHVFAAHEIRRADTANVTVTGPLGSDEAGAQDPQVAQRAPGPGLGLVLVGLAAAVLVVRRR